MSRKSLLLLLALGVGSASAAAAQTTTAAVSMQVPVTLYVDVGGSLAFNTTSITAADFSTGYRQSSSDLTVTHKGNVPYVVKVSAPQGATNLNFSALAGRNETGVTKPLSDVLLSSNGFTSSVPLSAAATTLITQTAATGSGSTTVRSRLNLDYATTPPGTYSTTITFTIAES